MKIQLLSDLHLEANPGFVPTPAADADLLVLAGDVGSYQRLKDGSVMPEPDWGLQRFSPRGGWPVPVLFVPGNHEYDALDVDQAHADLRATCARLGITWLERETVVIDGVRFVGTTLWSDYDTFVPPQAPLTEQLRQRHKAFRAANFYLHKMASQRSGALFDAAAMRELGLTCQAWLREALAADHDGPTVVVTHFAPTLHSADPRYGRLLQRAGRSAATRRPVAARPPALPDRCACRSLPHRGQSAGLCGQGRTGVVQAHADGRCGKPVATRTTQAVH